MAEEVSNLEELLDRIANAEDSGGRVLIRDIVQSIGARSFGPLLLFAGATLVSPLSGIPGVPTLSGVLILVIAAQLLLGRDHFWLPRWMLKRGIARARLCAAVSWVRRPAILVDRVIRPRLTPFVHGASTYAIAIICIIIALAMPAMELVPFSATTAGLAVAAFGLALIARDGLVAIIAFAATAGAAAAIVFAAF